MNLKKPVLNSRSAGLSLPGSSSHCCKVAACRFLFGILCSDNCSMYSGGGCLKSRKHNPHPNLPGLIFNSREMTSAGHWRARAVLEWAIISEIDSVKK